MDNLSTPIYIADYRGYQSKSEKALQIRPHSMTHEQTGIILTLADELGEFDKGLEFIKGIKSEQEAGQYINEMKERIDANG